ncbi:zinc ribbon domain-containing protein [Nocardioides sp.]|uniref:zinc ribbon domain-containing protein n=1 Tax=Nocardioides sp. TaxID=35761 RepID=UPI002732F5D5|nr:C4-type zinc ribbon domain-containing protein [Nocardioides sp.]MDP3893698.1 C4-type zinc ribbon domain-containing protein [Nocardioides sp.]
MTLKADPSAQLKLLDVQALDSRADQLRHQLASLPELAEIAALNQTRAELDNQSRDLQIVVDDLSTDQRKADADVEQVKARRTRDRDRIDQGLITNPKDLERMQHELISLDRRISTLEDEELEVMERLEEAQQSLTTVTEQIAAHDERLAALGASRDEKSAALRSDLEGVIAERALLVGDVPPDLLALYEKLRAAKGGSGAAALRARQCEGCRISIDAAELAVIKKAPSDEVVRCEECQRILVRTSESGL